MTDLRAELRECADQMALMIDFRLQDWKLDYPIWQAQDPTGRPLLGDLVAARGQVLAALAALSAP